MKKVALLDVPHINDDGTCSSSRERSRALRRKETREILPEAHRTGF